MFEWPRDFPQGFRGGNVPAAQVTTAGQTPELSHPAGRALSSDCFVHRFIMILEKKLVVPWAENCG